MASAGVPEHEGQRLGVTDGRITDGQASGTTAGALLDASSKALEVHRRLALLYPEAAEHESGDPVDELVCTILSQNTTDVARDRAYNSLRDAFPDWYSVRDAPAEQIENLIRVCGLANQKAPRIKGALAALSEHTGGELSLEFLREMQVEDARAWLTEIKGVGVKTASIVLLFALGMPAMPVDTHVHRTARRLGLIPDSTSVERAHHLLEAVVPQDLYLPLHKELVWHGRATCRARRPRCADCTLQDLCSWR